MSTSEARIPPRRRGRPPKALPELPDAGAEIVHLPPRPHEWVHVHPSSDKPLPWGLASRVPLLGRAMLDAVHEMSGPGNVIDSLSTAKSYQTWIRPFLGWLAESDDRECLAVVTGAARITPELFSRFKIHIDRRVKSGEITSKTGYHYKGTPLRLLRWLHDRSPSKLGDGWTFAHFQHDEFVNDHRQREPYTALEARRILDALSPMLSHWLSQPQGEIANRRIELAAYCIIGLRLGIESECLDRLTLNNLRPSADERGFVIRYLKRRAAKRSTRTTSPQQDSDMADVTASGTSIRTAGGVVAILKGRAEERARQDSAKSLLFTNEFKASHFARLTKWLHDDGLRGEDGSVLKIDRTRFRVTYKTASAVRHGGRLSLMPEDNTHDVNANHYLQSERLMPSYEQAIEDGAREALSHALRPIVIPETDPEDVDAISAIARSTGSSFDQIRDAVTGESDLWLASCKDFYNSPFDKSGSACSKPFYGCLACRNALVTRRSLPFILSFRDHIEGMRTTLSSGDWERRFGRAHEQIAHHILPAFPPEIINEAVAIAAGGGGRIHLPPEMLS